MTGRDPGETHRAATPLELLFDLAFVVAFGQAADQLAHLVAAGQIGPAVVGFGFAMFAVCWAWINVSWFASAYDTDDWYYRIATMVQMIGVVVLALGLPAMFDSLAAGTAIDNGVMVLGYVIMRIALMAQWLRAARQDPSRRPSTLIYVGFIVVAQAGWILLAVFELPTAVFFAILPVLFLIELGGPIVAERRVVGTPWHPHHIAERYGLLAIIALGEGVLGTVASVSAVVQEQGWSTEAALVVVAGIGLTFGLWWNYFVLPSGEVLARFRDRSFVWGYGHIVLFAAIAATGGGLHVAAYVIEGHAEIGTVGAVLAVAIPVLAYATVLGALYSYLLREVDPLHVLIFAGTVAVLVVAVALAMNGVPIGVSLLVVTLSPVVAIVGFETVGHRHREESLARLTR
jgi:low temperature requirement protein LtrA